MPLFKWISIAIILVCIIGHGLIEYNEKKADSDFFNSLLDEELEAESKRRETEKIGLYQY